MATIAIFHAQKDIFCVYTSFGPYLISKERRVGE